MNSNLRASRTASRRSLAGLIGFLAITLATVVSCNGQERGSNTTQSAAASPTQ